MVRLCQATTRRHTIVFGASLWVTLLEADLDVRYLFRSCDGINVLTRECFQIAQNANISQHPGPVRFCSFHFERSDSSLHDAYIRKPPDFGKLCARRKPARSARCIPYRQRGCIHDRRKVTYPGTNNYTQWTYDGFGRRVKEVETRSGSVNEH